MLFYIKQKNNLLRHFPVGKKDVEGYHKYLIYIHYQITEWGRSVKKQRLQKKTSTNKNKNGESNLNVIYNHLIFFFNGDLRSKIIDDDNASNKKLKGSKRNINEFHYLESNNNLVQCLLVDIS